MATPNLVLPELVAGQTQAETTVNLAMREIDVLLQGLVLDRDLTTPPGSPVAGDTYIPLATATDVWTGHEDDIAWFDGSAWQFKTPNEGWVFRVADEDVRVEFDGATWVILGGGGGGAGLIPVSSFTLGAAAASFDISGFDSSSRLWKLVLNKLQGVSSAAPRALLEIGGTFQTTNYEHKTNIMRSDNSSYAGANAISSAELQIGGATSWVNTAGRAGQLELWFFNPAQTTDRKIITYIGSHFNGTPRLTHIDGRGSYHGGTGALTAIRIEMSTGNVQAGVIADLYKLDTP